MTIPGVGAWASSKETERPDYINLSVHPNSVTLTLGFGEGVGVTSGVEFELGLWLGFTEFEKKNWCKLSLFVETNCLMRSPLYPFDDHLSSLENVNSHGVKIDLLSSNVHSVNFYIFSLFFRFFRSFSLILLEFSSGKS